MTFVFNDGTFTCLTSSANMVMVHPQTIYSIIDCFSGYRSVNTKKENNPRNTR